MKNLKWILSVGHLHAIFCDAIAMQKLQITIACVLHCVMAMFAITNILWLIWYWHAIFCNGVSSNNKVTIACNSLCHLHSVQYVQYAMFCNGIQCHNQNEWCITSTLRLLHCIHALLMLRNDKSSKLIITPNDVNQFKRQMMSHFSFALIG